MGKDAVQDEGPPGDREMSTAIFEKSTLQNYLFEASWA